MPAKYKLERCNQEGSTKNGFTWEEAEAAASTDKNGVGLWLNTPAWNGRGLNSDHDQGQFSLIVSDEIRQDTGRDVCHFQTIKSYTSVGCTKVQGRSDNNHYPHL